LSKDAESQAKKANKRGGRNMNVKIGLKSGLIHESRFFKYVVAGKTMAEIEALIFDEKHFGSQARVFTEKGEKAVLSGRTFPDVEEALSDVLALIEDEIKDDPWVVKSEEFAEKKGKLDES